MLNILKSPGFTNMDDGMKARVVQLMYENAVYDNLNAKPGDFHHDTLRGLNGLSDLLKDPQFLSLPPEEQSSQLNAFKTTPRDSDLYN
jgi:hypothetical protein